MGKSKELLALDAKLLREKMLAAERRTLRHVRQHAWHWSKTGKMCPAQGNPCVEAECQGKLCALMSEVGHDARGQPLKKRRRPKCGAKTRQGLPCKMGVEAGKRRCRLHGGLSTGPKTKKGRELIAAAQRRRWAKT